MTEYDYSPQAWERYIATQHRIANWVDGTLKERPCNAFTPATPHVQALRLQEENERKQRRRERAVNRDSDLSDDDDDYDSRYARSSHTRHRKTQSTKEPSTYRSPRKDRPREPERERDPMERRDRSRPRDQERSSTRYVKYEKPEKHSRKDKDYVWVERSSPSPPPSTRARSSSQSVTSKPRPSHGARTHATPHLSLDLPPFPPRPQDPYYYHNRYSGDSSQSSVTTPNSGSTTHGMFPVGQVPHSAPPVTGQGPMLGGNAPKPNRSQTMPYAYTGYHQVTDKNGYPVNRAIGSQPVVLPIRPGMNGVKSYGGAIPYAPDPSKAPQFPYSAYQLPSKSQSLLKRMFGFKANKNESAPPPQQYRPPPEGVMFLGGGSGRRVARKRSISF